MKPHRRHVTGISTLLCCLAVLSGRLIAAEPAPPDLTAGGVRDEAGEKTVLEGVKGWLYQWDGETTHARQVLVTRVVRGSPWNGLLQTNDVIVGVDGRPFERDARLVLGDARRKADEAGPEGVIHLLRWRAGKTEPVTLKMAGVPDLTRGGNRDENHDWTLGPTGLRGWVYGRKAQTADARQILVTAVAKGSPADGLLKTNDVILGVNGRSFDGDARLQFAQAITAAEREEAGGRLGLIRWRAGETTNVDLTLQVMGTYRDTAPYDCHKSMKIFEQGCRVIAKRGLKGGIDDDLNALALLASGKEEYRPLLAEYARRRSEYKTDSMATWFYGYANIFLAEYYLATGDKAILPGVKRLALESARGQSAVGTWGHKFARPDGNLNGYGCMNQPGLSLMISMVLARQAGVEDPVLDRAIAKGAGFLRWYVNKGAIPYGDHAPWPAHEDNGKCSSAAVLFDLLGDGEAASFFARMSTAAYSERERGHTGNFFNILWALPGVSRCGPLATGAYLKEDAWYYDLARDWQGGFSYQGNPPGAEEHNKYTGWDCTGSYLLAYALPLKSLYITGRKPSAVPVLSRQEVAEVIAAGRDFFPVNGRNGYDARHLEALLAGLSSWSPAVRGRSAQALGRREDDVVPALVKMLASSNRDTRYGACEALGCLGARADAAAPQLRALLHDPDPWLQSLACKALSSLGAEAGKASVNDLLAMIVRPNPADPRRMAQRAAAVALFSASPGTRTPTILSRSLDGVDRGLLYPAMMSLLQNEDSVARGALGWTYAKLTDQDLAVLLPAIVTATEQLAPSDEMFGDGIRLEGLDLLSRLHIREGMALCVSVMEPERWGAGNRVPKCIEYLGRYGTHGLPLLLETQRKMTGGKTQAEIVTLLDTTIKAATNSPVLRELKEFTANAPASMGPKEP